MRRDSIELVKSVFCKINNISPINLDTKVRAIQVVETRRMIWAYLRQNNTNLTLDELGQMFKRDHSTTLHNLNKHAIATSIAPSGVIYDVDYTERYRAGVLEIKHMIEDQEKEWVFKNYMLTYYSPSGDYYISPTVKATSILEAINEYESYNSMTDEELILAKLV